MQTKAQNRNGIAFLFVFLILHDQVNCQLAVDFYDDSCPSVEDIVTASISDSVQRFPITVQAVLRLFFHDCFIEGCDASILISSKDNTAEKDAAPNLSLAGDGFTAIINAKSQVEAQCPGMVSCADILALAAREAVVLAGGPTWDVLKGRRDGTISLASRVEGNLPEAKFNVDELAAVFGAKGLNLQDMVTLSGAHTLGFAHCDQFTERLYQFSSTSPVDPTMDPNYAAKLQAACPSRGADEGVVEPLDAASPGSFNNDYYTNLEANQGLLASDQILFTDDRTAGIVDAFATDQSTFFQAFADSMVKLGNVGVKTGDEGEIRKDCTAFNP